MRSIRGALCVGVVLCTLGTSAPHLPGPYVPPGDTSRASLDGAGGEHESDSSASNISADGRTVDFRTRAALVSDDTNGVSDLYVKELDTGHVERVSVSSSGAQISDESPSAQTPAALSADGRTVAFESGASELVEGDTNDVDDVFVRFRDRGETVRVSVATTGAQAAAHSNAPALSADGRFVFFLSEDDTLVPDDVSPYQDIFRLDLSNGTLTLVSVDNDGRQSVFDPTEFAVNGDGTVVAWTSRSPTYGPPDLNAAYSDVFVRDLVAGTTTRITHGHDGTPGSHHSYDPTLSADGRFVAFGSLADNLVPADRNGVADVFVHDRQTARTTRVSLGSDLSEATSGGGSPTMSSDGRTIAFNSARSGLDPLVSDSNGSSDVYVHDRITGATSVVSVTPMGTTGSAISLNPRPSAQGRHIAFQSRSDDLVADDGNEHADIFVRDRGPSFGIGAAAIDEAGRVTGWARFADIVVVATDPVDDADMTVRDGGGEIVGGSAVWRPEHDDVRFAAELHSLPSLTGTNVTGIGVAYRIRFTLADAIYEVRLDPADAFPPAEGPAPGRLMRCAPQCEQIGTVATALGGAGRSLVAVVPVASLEGAERGAATNLSVTTTWTGPNPTTTGDTMPLGDMDLGAPRVEVAAAPIGTPVELAPFVDAALTAGRFSADVGPAMEPRTVWARSCLGDHCTPAVEVAASDDT